MTSMRHRATRRARRAGYTLIEVMMALGVLTAGAVGVLGLQQAVMRGNLEARQIATATHIASTWIERLQRDAIGWSRGGPGVVFSATDLVHTRYLNRVPAVGDAPVWFEPVMAAPATERATFDHFGRETAVAADMRFCTNVRLQWVYEGDAMRADVRVWWPRRTASAQTAALQGCSAPDLQTLGTRTRDVGFVYASTVIRWTPVPGAAR
ncbi:type IV pilus modification PilV family protein [Sandaracinus amylolyticus]|uniref:Type IV fimbrial biogenesis protein PilV n=1 Tax=Sandaracinus amylolyticus TaxID=927083 RepID=A0A0F6YFZ9_9BACT|nr:prepilin-type N-terminal cleavage/methylation domain-containing protein [Sandaracinus amylolyticus]AKF03263.1 hypothetical protein DB32_000412 [Sandaracinus amylolyticus]